MSSLVARISYIDIRRAAIFLFGTIAIMAVMGIWAAAFDPGNPWFDLDSEVHLRWPLDQTTIAFPALWSGLLLVWAGLVWLAAATLVAERLTRLLVGALGVFLLFMSLDEMLTWHEHLQYWTGIRWWVLYAPLVLLMAVVVLTLMYRLWRIDRLATMILVAACAAWGFAQILELIQWRGEVKIPEYVLLMVPEELGEATGSILFGLAGVSVVKTLQAGRSPNASDPM